MITIDQTYEMTVAHKDVPRKWRLLALHGALGASLIDIEAQPPKEPVHVSYEVWQSLADSFSECDDPFKRPWPKVLPPKAAGRLKVAETLLPIEVTQDALLGNSVQSIVSSICKGAGISRWKARQWVYGYLQGGREARAIFSKFYRPNHTLQACGAKRGPKKAGPCSNVPIHEIREQIRAGLEKHRFTAKMTLADAYNEMLFTDFGVPREYGSPESRQYLLTDPELLKKYRIPTPDQVWGVYRKMLKEKKMPAAPRGRRGRANLDIDGPGHYEIDGTCLQVQCVSRITARELVGRPCLYLVIDRFSDAIVGYHITLDNFCWAAASLALFNAFSDKGDVFKRLKLPFESKDWDAFDIACELTADRAELITDDGSEFARSGVLIRITPSMCPIAKGNVEGANSEVKRLIREINLSGLYSKIRIRRGGDGKSTAALDMFVLEQCVVEFINDLNRLPLPNHRIPKQALADGPLALTRIGLYAWGRKNRPGGLRKMPPFFAQDHLLPKDKAVMTPLGLLYKTEYYMCDHLDTLGWRNLAATNEHFDVDICYHSLDGSFVYFVDPATGSWHLARNTDAEVALNRWSFAELKEYRATRTGQKLQARLMHHNAHMESVKRNRKRDADARAAMQDAVGDDKRPKSEQAISDNRDSERRRGRGKALDPIHNATPAPPPAAPAEAPATSSKPVAPADAAAFCDDAMWDQAQVVSD